MPVGNLSTPVAAFFRVDMLRHLLHSLLRYFPSALLFLLVGLLTLPVLAVALSWLQFDSEASAILVQMLQTVLPDYIWTSLLLCLFVAFGVAAVGMASASASRCSRFRGGGSLSGHCCCRWPCQPM
jgi:iron(III) transport system permease protein